MLTYDDSGNIDAAKTIQWGPIARWNVGDPNLYESVDGGNTWLVRRPLTEDEERAALELALQHWSTERAADESVDVKDLFDRLQSVARWHPAETAKC